LVGRWDVERKGSATELYGVGLRNQKKKKEKEKEVILSVLHKKDSDEN